MAPYPYPPTSAGIRTAYALGYTNGRRAAARPDQAITTGAPDDREVICPWDGYLLGFWDGLLAEPPRRLDTAGSLASKGTAS